MENEFYHIFLVGVSGRICFRTAEDYFFFINILATSGPQFGLKVVAYCCLPRHVHLGIELLTDVSDIKADPKGFASMVCFRYTKYFTRKYSEHGSVFCKPGRLTNFVGRDAIRVVLSQILRNPVKHGFSSTAFNYQYSSAGYYFEECFGTRPLPKYTFKVNALLSNNYTFPKEWKVLTNGLLDPHFWLDIQRAEAKFRNFADFMNYVIVKESDELEKDIRIADVTLEYFAGEFFGEDLAGELADCGSG